MILGMGIGIGCSISASETTKPNDGLVRTEYLRPVWGYNIGWRYDRSAAGGMYDLSFKFMRVEPKPSGGFRIPFLNT
jgi:hypothetical protein